MKERVNQIISSMKSFEKDTYDQNELIDEIFCLEREMVNIAFNSEHSSSAKLKIIDVENHLEYLNNECGEVANEQLAEFKNESRNLCNYLRAALSGRKGENRAYHNLRHSLTDDGIFIRNLQVRDGSLLTEIDMLVITGKGVSIIEVKNTKKNIFIDREGNYYRNSEYQRLEYNIAKKMSLREEIIKGILENEGYPDVPIQSIIVFTDDSIEIHNDSDVRTCFLGQLSYFVEDFEDRKTVLANDSLDDLGEILYSYRTSEGFPIDFDIDSYKMHFATLMAILEESNNNRVADKVVIEPEFVEFAEESCRIDEHEKEIDIMESLKEILLSRYTWGVIGGILGAIGGAVLSNRGSGSR